MPVRLETGPKALPPCRPERPVGAVYTIFRFPFACGAIPSRVLQFLLMRIFGHLWRSLRQLFHEAIGSLFFIFSGIGAVSAVRQWSNPAGHWIAWLAAAYALLMAVFGVSSFRASRQVR